MILVAGIGVAALLAGIELGLIHTPIDSILQVGSALGALVQKVVGSAKP